MKLHAYDIVITKTPLYCTKICLFVSVCPSYIPNIDLPVYSGKQIVKGDLRIFSSNKSFLLRKRIMEVSPNHLLLQMESNNFRLSCIRFWKERIKIISKSNLTIQNNLHIMLHQIGMHVSGGEEIDIGRFSKSRKDSAIKRIIFAMF